LSWFLAYFFLVYGYKEIVSIPYNFPVDSHFTIEENEPLRSISKRLEEQGYVTSALLFRVGVSFFGKDRAIHLGGYVFDSPQSLMAVIAKFTKEKPDLPLLSITIPEGSTSAQIATPVSYTHLTLPTM
jgi:cell division protein YceG involved in septum cleavage